MRASRLALAICAVAWLSSCASFGGQVEQIAMPTDDEVTAYVTNSWASYERRVSLFANRPGQSSELVSADDVQCADYFGIPDCQFTVVVKFPDGSLFERQLESTFDRDQNGALFETIVLIHERVR